MSSEVHSKLTESGLDYHMVEKKEKYSSRKGVELVESSPQDASFGAAVSQRAPIIDKQSLPALK